jgi:hypothetical protein
VLLSDVKLAVKHDHSWALDVSLARCLKRVRDDASSPTITLIKLVFIGLMIFSEHGGAIERDELDSVANGPVDDRSIMMPRKSPFVFVADFF